MIINLYVISKVEDDTSGTIVRTVSFSSSTPGHTEGAANFTVDATDDKAGFDALVVGALTPFHTA